MENKIETIFDHNPTDKELMRWGGKIVCEYGVLYGLFHFAFVCIRKLVFDACFDGFEKMLYLHLKSLNNEQGIVFFDFWGVPDSLVLLKGR